MAHCFNLNRLSHLARIRVSAVSQLFLYPVLHCISYLSHLARFPKLL